jgi:hypothetical protein
VYLASKGTDPDNEKMDSLFSPLGVCHCFWFLASFVFPKIPDGDFCAARYEIPGDSHYEVLVTLESGKTISLES